MPLTTDEIRNRMTYHAPSPKGIERHADLATSIGRAMHEIEDACIDSREKSLAITKLEEAKFWASAAVARNPETR
jgi:hypothetical protein